MLTIKGETRVDYLHLLCEKCGSAVHGRTGTDGAIATITFTCDTCERTDTLKLWQIYTVAKDA